jgi:hypothetical protein
VGLGQAANPSKPPAAKGKSSSCCALAMIVLDFISYLKIGFQMQNVGRHQTASGR